MRYGVTPFQLSAEIWTALSEIGIEPIPWDLPPDGDAEVALLYDSPDQLIALASVGVAVEEWTSQSLVQGYRSLLSRSEQTQRPLVAISRLLHHRNHESVLPISAADGPCVAATAPAADPTSCASPELAACVLTLLDAEPALLEAYQDLELRADLLGREPDLHYRERLRKVAHNADSLLKAHFCRQQALVTSKEQARQVAALQECLTGKDAALMEARQDAELTLLQLHQVQKELEQVFHADRDKQQRLELSLQDMEELRRLHETCQIHQEQDLTSMREAFAVRLAGLEECLAGKETALQETSEETELTLLQLNQVQTELEQIVHADREKQRLLEANIQDMEALRVLHEASKIRQAHELESISQDFEKRSADLRERLAVKERELQETREEAELTLRQLHQVQEELEHYFLEARATGQLATAQMELLTRARSLFSRLQQPLTTTHNQAVAVNVEVVAGMTEFGPGTTSLQTEALLKAYASSLERASGLLERARFRQR